MCRPYKNIEEVIMLFAYGSYLGIVGIGYVGIRDYLGLTG